MTMTEDTVRRVVAEQAAEWLVTLRSGELNSTERTRFAEWLRQSPLHVEEYLAVSQASDELSALISATPLQLNDAELDAIGSMYGGENVVALPSQKSVSDPHAARASRRWTRVPAAIAASALVALSLLWVLHNPPESGRFVTYSTARGEQRSIVLADGSLLYLNSDSEIRVRYQQHERELQLQRGQAFFKVAHDKTRPFRVFAGSVEAVAVGTQFDVYRRSSDTLVTVVEGKVAVDATPINTSLASPHQPIELIAGQRAQVDSATAVQVVAVNPDDATAWTRHQIVFERESLADIASEFNRYSSIPVEIEDAHLRELRLSGVLDSYDLASFVEFLQRLSDVEVVATPRRVVVKTRALRASSSAASRAS